MNREKIYVNTGTILSIFLWPFRIWSFFTLHKKRRNHNTWPCTTMQSYIMRFTAEKLWPLAKTALAKPVLRHTHAKKRKSQWLLFSSTREAIHTYKTQCKRWRYITNWASSDVCAKTPKPSQQSCVDNTSTQHIHAHKLPHTLSFLHSLMLNPLSKDTRDGKRHRCYTHTCS